MFAVLGILFIVVFENIPVVIGLIITAILLKKAVKWLKEHPEECQSTFLDQMGGVENTHDSWNSFRAFRGSGNPFRRRRRPYVVYFETLRGLLVFSLQGRKSPKAMGREMIANLC